MSINPRSLPFQIVVAAATGITVGYFLRPEAFPDAKIPDDMLSEADLASRNFRKGALDWAKLLSDSFLHMIKMVVPPLMICVVAGGIAGAGDAKRSGRVGVKALVYFNVVTLIALTMGLIAVNVFRPGEGMDIAAINAASATGDANPDAQVKKYAAAAKEQSLVTFLGQIIPENIYEALARGNLLPVLFFAVILGIAIIRMGARGRPVQESLHHWGDVLLQVVGLAVKLSPVGVLGAMTVMVGKYGLSALVPLAWLLAVCYGTMIVFVVVVLGAIMRAVGLSLWHLLRHIREEIVLVLGMSSSEAALPRVMHKMETYGCSRPLVGLVVPTGYSFNLDGTAVYLTIAAIFIAQAYGMDLDFGQQLKILLILMLTSKGAAAVTGGGFIALAATLESTHIVPVAGLALIFGVDRLLSEARATVNLIGNSVACVVVSKWEGDFDEEKMRRSHEAPPPETDVEAAAPVKPAGAGKGSDDSAPGKH